MGERARFEVLGPLRVELGGRPVRIGGLKPRLVLAMLLLTRGRVVSTDRLIAGLWDENPPDGALNTLQAHVSHLRRLLTDAEVTVRTEPPGYVLPVWAAQLDLLEFEDLTGTARELAGAGQREQAVDRFATALGLWRGVPLGDLGTGSFAENARTFLAERRLGAVDDRLGLLLGLRRYREVVEEAETALDESPLHESLWEKLIIGLYRSGRPADALARYRDCRMVLNDELGVDPMPRLQELERQILNHDERLAPGPMTTSMVIPTTATPELAETVSQLRPRRLNATLELPDGSVVALAAQTLLGRHPDCDVVLVDSSVSRRHAEIRLAKGRHVLLDLSSVNGTWVHNRPVLQHLLEDGDTFEVGDVRLLYRVG